MGRCSLSAETHLPDVEFKDYGMDSFIESLKDIPVIRVGILGNKSKASKRSTASNASIGVKHEFGQDGMPQRSFLRMPLIERLQPELEFKTGLLTEASIKQVVKERSLKSWMLKIAIVCEAVIADAFDTGGFGKWRPSNMKFKKNKQTLVETQQLRNSITSEVKA